MRFLAVVLLTLALTACARSYDVFVASRTTTASGHTTVTTTLGNRNAGAVSIVLAGKVYTGRWVYMPNGGAVSFSSATAFSANAQPITAVGTATAIPMQGNGSIIASAPDGAVLHCAFNFSSLTRTGTGLCQDNDSRIYDLQITPQ